MTLDEKDWKHWPKVNGKRAIPPAIRWARVVELMDEIDDCEGSVNNADGNEVHCGGALEDDEGSALCSECAHRWHNVLRLTIKSGVRPCFITDVDPVAEE